MLRIHAPVAVFRGTATRKGEKVAHIEHLVLAFGSEVIEHLSKRELEGKLAAVPSPATTAVGTNGQGPDLPVAKPTAAEDAPKGSVSRDDRARLDSEDPVVKGEPASAGRDDGFDRNFGI